MNFFSCDGEKRRENQGGVVWCIVYQVNISSVNPLSDPTTDIRKLIYWLDKHWPSHGQPGHQQRFYIITITHHHTIRDWKIFFNNSRKILFS